MKCLESRHARRSPAIMLIECIVYLAVLALVFGLALTAFYNAWKNHRELDRTSQDILQALRAGERWRDDVRQASAPPTYSGTLDHPTFLIPHPHGDILYRFQSNSVWRIVARTTNQMLVLDQFKSSRLEADPRKHVKAWRWELELLSRRQEVHTVPLFTFLAATSTSTHSAPPPPP